MKQYKIVGFEDGYGKKWYRVKVKWFLGIWCYYREYHGFFDDVGTIVEKESLKEAKKIVGYLKENDKVHERKFKSCLKT